VKKGVTKTLEEATESRHLAVTKIQAAFRGYQVRKMLKMDNNIEMKNKNYVNTEAVDDFHTKPLVSTQPDTGSTSLRHEGFRSLNPQEIDILGKCSFHDTMGCWPVSDFGGCSEAFTNKFLSL
jgi:hypothetical protein